MTLVHAPDAFQDHHQFAAAEKSTQLMDLLAYHADKVKLQAKEIDHVFHWDVTQELKI